MKSRNFNRVYLYRPTYLADETKNLQKTLTKQQIQRVGVKQQIIWQMKQKICKKP